MKKLDPQEKKILKAVIKAAKTKEEVDLIEKQIRAGTFDFSLYDTDGLKRSADEDRPEEAKKAKTESYEIDTLD